MPVMNSYDKSDLPIDKLERARERRRRWRKANADRARQQLREQSERWRAANPERSREIKASSRERRREVRRPILAERARKFGAANREICAKRLKHWRDTNPGVVKAAYHKRRARVANVLSEFTADDWRALVARSLRCHWCKQIFGKKCKPTHDHVIPLALGGPNTIENSVCSCRGCNSKKGAKLSHPFTGQGILL